MYPLKFSTLLLVFAFTTFKVEVSCSLISKVVNSLHSAKKSLTFVHKTLHGLNHDPLGTLVEKYFPESGDLLVKPSPKLDSCYNAVNSAGERHSIFENPIGTIVHQFLVSRLKCNLFLLN